MADLIDWQMAIECIPSIVEVFPVTLVMLVGSLFWGLLIAFATAIFQIYKIPVARQISAAYVDFIRGTPQILQLFLVYYAIPSILQKIGIDVSSFTKMFFVIIAFSVNVGAYLSETLRGAFLSVDCAQKEAAYSIGMTSVQVFCYIVLPQALKLAIPSMGNSIISLLKETSLAFNIGMIDMMGRAKTIGNVTHRFFEIYIAVALVYWGCSILLEFVFLWLENRLDKEGRQAHGKQRRNTVPDFSIP